MTYFGGNCISAIAPETVAFIVRAVVLALKV